MIKHIFISNFKSMHNFNVDLKPITAIIGENSSGKSSLLQALDFICKFVQRDTVSYMESREWRTEDILCKFLKGAIQKQLHFRISLDLDVEGEVKDILWDINLVLNSTSTGLIVINEGVYLDIGETNGAYTYPLLQANSKGIVLKPYPQTSAKNIIEEKYPFFSSESSFLKIIDNKIVEYPILNELKKFFMQSESFELLSPSSLRQGSRGKADSIGYWGEKIGAYLKGLSADKQIILVEQIKTLIPFITDIQTKVKGKPGWIDLSTKEQFGEITYVINSKHISDGLLRIIALLSIAQSSRNSGIVLLDEIENGINPYLAEKVVHFLNKVVENTHRQIIVTTHNSVMLDYFDPTSIVYLYRGKGGETQATALFDRASIKDRLEYLYPGEAWLNLTQDEIQEVIKDDEELKD